VAVLINNGGRKSHDDDDGDECHTDIVPAVPSSGSAPRLQLLLSRSVLESQKNTTSALAHILALLSAVRPEQVPSCAAEVRWPSCWVCDDVRHHILAPGGSTPERWQEATKLRNAVAVLLPSSFPNNIQLLRLCPIAHNRNYVQALIMCSSPVLTAA
jgi:hypothetical protein